MSVQSKHRPISRFSPPFGWSNDPCGAIFIPETEDYLLCYQWRPESVLPGNSAWGMAKSKDLVTWTDCEPALLNGVETQYDSQGVFSGSITSKMVDGKRQLYLFYTSISYLPLHWSIDYVPGQETQSVAISTDYGNSWYRHKNNPLIRNPPFQKQTTGWRDPFVSTWESLSKLKSVPLSTSYMLLGSGEKAQGPSLMLYQSQDLLHWTPLSTLLSGERDSPIMPGSRMSWGRNFECPSFFTFKDTEYLIVGIEENSILSNYHAARHVIWLSGKFTLGWDSRPKFQIASSGRLDHGIMYAAHVFRGPDNEVLQMGWNDEDANNMQVEQNFAGCLGLPRQLNQISIAVPQILPSDMSIWSLDSDKDTMTTLGISPANQTKVLRHGSSHYTINSFSELRSTSFEIQAKFGDLQGNETLTFKVRQTPNEREVTQIIFSIPRSTITIDRARSSIDNGNPDSESGPFELLNRGTAEHQLYEDLDIKVFVDNSVIEVFANDRFCLSSRVYPSNPDANRASFSICDEDGEKDLASFKMEFDCWADLAAAWPHRQVKEEKVLKVSENQIENVETCNLMIEAVAA